MRKVWKDCKTATRAVKQSDDAMVRNCEKKSQIRSQWTYFSEGGVRTFFQQHSVTDDQSWMTRTNRDDSVYISPVMNETFMYILVRPLAQEKCASARILAFLWKFKREKKTKNNVDFDSMVVIMVVFMVVIAK